jgi:SAM-dependent methyltransferase
VPTLPAMNTTRHASALDRLAGQQLDALLSAATLDALRPRFNTLRDRADNGTAPRAVSAFQLFQTPPDLAARLVALLDLAPGARVLEPSAGLGRILDALTPAQPAEAVAVEHAPQLAAELFRQDRARVRLLQRDFLTCTPAELGTFDAVAMNPPFHLRADIRHTLHALAFLRPGGVLAGLCMDTPHRAAALRPLCDEWQPIPAGAFRAEGTGVPVILFRIRK